MGTAACSGLENIWNIWPDVLHIIHLCRTTSFWRPSRLHRLDCTGGCSYLLESDARSLTHCCFTPLTPDTPVSLTPLSASFLVWRTPVPVLPPHSQPTAALLHLLRKVFHCSFTRGTPSPKVLMWWWSPDSLLALGRWWWSSLHSAASSEYFNILRWWEDRSWQQYRGRPSCFIPCLQKGVLMSLVKCCAWSRPDGAEDVFVSWVDCWIFQPASSGPGYPAMCSAPGSARSWPLRGSVRG